MKKVYFFLIVNSVLWLYTINYLINGLLEPKNALARKVKSTLSGTHQWLSVQWTQIQHFIFNWKTVIFIVLVIAFIFFLIKFWHFTFLLMCLFTLLVIIWDSYLFITGHFSSENLYFVAVVLVSLGNIWISPMTTRR